MLHCNGIDPFITLMGNFNWGPISCNNIVSVYTLVLVSIVSTVVALDTKVSTGLIYNIHNSLLRIYFVEIIAILHCMQTTAPKYDIIIWLNWKICLSPNFHVWEIK